MLFNVGQVPGKLTPWQYTCGSALGNVRQQMRHACMAALGLSWATSPPQPS
jgi:hypothetical protein